VDITEDEARPPTHGPVVPADASVSEEIILSREQIEKANAPFSPRTSQTSQRLPVLDNEAGQPH